MRDEPTSGPPGVTYHLSIDTASLTYAAQQIGQMSTGPMPTALATMTTLDMQPVGEPTLDGWLTALSLAWRAALARVQVDTSTIGSNTLLAATVFDDAEATLTQEAKEIQEQTPKPLGPVEYN